MSCLPPKAPLWPDDMPFFSGEGLYKIPPDRIARRPHKCPVCEGSGNVPEHKFSSKPVECKACSGKGVAWEPE